MILLTQFQSKAFLLICITIAAYLQQSFVKNQLNSTITRFFTIKKAKNSSILFLSSLTFLYPNLLPQMALVENMRFLFLRLNLKELLRDAEGNRPALRRIFHLRVQI